VFKKFKNKLNKVKLTHPDLLSHEVKS
jgi:hypothetical protein